MSLGYSSNNKRHVTNLSGSTGNMFVKARQTKKNDTDVTVRSLLSKMNTNNTNIVSILPTKKEDQPPQPPPPVSNLETHFVYGTAQKDFLDESDGAIICKKGDDIMLVYPMQTNKDTGEVKMRMKKINAHTAQLSYTWIVVYTGFEDDTRLVTDFRLVS